MVTCPIDMYSTADVELRRGEGVLGPPGSPKATEAVRATLEHLGETGMGGKLRLASPLPRGKGMASSTADVSASIAATAAALDFELPPCQIAEIALGVEPSDGIMFPGIALFDHREGCIAQPIGTPPPMRIVVLDFGGNVDTEEFNQVDRRHVLTKIEAQVAEAVSLISEGLQCGDAARIGRGATLSALANQRVLFKPHLDPVIELSQRVGALGVNVAHSGTVIGMLFEDDILLVERAMFSAKRDLPAIESIRSCRIIGGGVTRL